MFRLMNGVIDKQPYFLALTEKTSQGDFLQLRQQNEKILTYPTSKDKIVLLLREEQHISTI